MTTTSNPTGLLAGFNCAVLTNTTLLFEAGYSMWVWTGPPRTGSFAGQVISPLQNITLDITKIGLGGVDVNPNGVGNLPPPGAYDCHGFWNPTTDDLQYILSFIGATPDVPGIPAGYTGYRKIPIFIPVDNNGLVPTAISGWPHPTTTYTNSTLVKELRDIPAGGLGTLSAPYPIDISKYVGENCRLGGFGLVITNGTATVYLGCGPNSGSQQFMKICAFAEAGVKPYCKTRFMQQTLYAMVIPITGNPEVDVYIVDVDQIEQS